MIRAAVLGAALLPMAATAAAAPEALVPNRAIYDLSLANTRAGGLLAAHGRVVIEFRDVCDGWNTTQRMVADISDADGKVSRTDFVIDAWESKAGREMRFDITNSADGRLLERQRGDAKLGADGAGNVSLAQPKPLQFALPRGSEFPTGQVVDILKAVDTDRSLLKGVVFQGGDKTGIFFSTALVGRKHMPSAAQLAADKGGLIKNVPAWPVLVSYFANDATSETPEYEIDSDLFANGVVGSMSMIYAKYTLKATLVDLEPLPPNC